MMGKKGKFDLSEGDDFNLSPLEKLLKIPSEIANIHKEIVEIIDEINYVYKSFANLRPVIAKIGRGQFTAAVNGGGNQV
jgi:hypothetical protein